MKSNDKYIYKKVIVIGTGPAAAACVKILLRKKIKPLLLDIGLKKIPSTTRFNKKELRKIPSHNLKKFCFGSFDHLSNKHHLGFLNSVGFGGFSNVWGGSINKIGKNEIKKWPVSFNKFEKYYKIIDTFFNQFGNIDLYSKIFKLSKPKLLSKKFFDLMSGKFFISGYSRIALSKKKNIPFSSYEYFDQLIHSGKIEYLNNKEITKLSEKKDLVYIFQKDKIVAKCNKLFLAAGAFNSSIIILNSIPQLKEINFKESKLIVSLWKHRSTLKKPNNNRYSDYYISSIKPPFVHSQVYFLKPDIIKSIKIDYLIISKIFKYLLKSISKNFFLIFTYVGDEASDSIKIKNGSVKNILLKKGFKYQKIYNNFIKKLAIINKDKISYTGIKYKTRFGTSYHFGSSFPMSKKSSLRKTDIKGRLKCFNNIHLIDGSILPTIPTTTITYTIMANAARITNISIKN